MARNVEKWLRTPLSGFVIGTAVGEETSLGEDEKVAIVRTVHAARDGRRVLIAGIDVPSVSETLRLAERYAAAGADLVRVRLPRNLPSAQVESYFGEVASGAPIPIIAIHQTFDTGPAAPPEVIGAICGLGNVFGYITDRDLRFEGWVRPYVPDHRRFWICNGGLLAYGTLLGANGACMWLGNIAPALCMDIVKAGYDGDFARARELQTAASVLDREVGRLGPGAVKAALSALGYEMSGPRAPRRGVNAEERIAIEDALNTAGLIV